MMTDAQRAAWFTYRAPTDETAPKYAAIRAAENAVLLDITQTIYENVETSVLHDQINRSTRRFAEVIDEKAPDCADKTAAIRCVRLARNLFNEYAAQSTLSRDQQSWSDVLAPFRAAELELAKARMQANSAIACEGV